MEYVEQLKSPKWQKKRLEIFERDEFACQSCGDTEEQLQIHHITYRKNKKIWECENSDLLTLCAGCHKEITEIKSEIKLNIDTKYIHSEELYYLNDIIKAL